MENDTENSSLDARAGKVVIAIYLSAAQKNFDEAERLAERALALREAGMAMLNRAKEVAVFVAKSEP